MSPNFQDVQPMSQTIGQNAMQPVAQSVVQQSNISVSDARRIIEEQNRKRIESCGTEIQEILTKYSCRFEIRMIIGTGIISPIIDIVPVS